MGISFVKAIVDNCINLRELNMVNSMIGEEELSCLVNNLTSKIEILSFHHVDKLNDDHVKVLVKNCNKLKVLDLRKTVTTKKSLTYIAQNLRSLEELNTNINFDLTDIHQLSLIPTLRIFTSKWNKKTITLDEEKALKKHLPDLENIEYVKESAYFY